MQLYTLEEVASILRVSIQTVRRMISSGELQAIKVKGQWRIRKDVLEAYIEAQQSSS